MEFLTIVHAEEIQNLKDYLVSFYKDEKSAVVALDHYVKYVQANLTHSDMKRIAQPEHNKALVEIDLETFGMGARFDSIKFRSSISTHLKEFVEAGLSLILYGYNGSGKTHFAKQILYDAIGQGYGGYYIVSTDLQQLYNKVSFSGKATELESALLDYIRNCDLLVIDEVGKETLSDAFLVSFESILKHRTARDKSTIQVTNLQLSHGEVTNLKSEYKTRYGASIYNLLFEHYRLICFSRHGEFRLKERKEWF